MFFYFVDDMIVMNLKNFFLILIGEWGLKVRLILVSILIDEV